MIPRSAGPLPSHPSTSYPRCSPLPWIPFPFVLKTGTKMRTNKRDINTGAASICVQSASFIRSVQLHLYREPPPPLPSPPLCYVPVGCGCRKSEAWICILMTLPTIFHSLCLAPERRPLATPRDQLEQSHRLPLLVPTSSLPLLLTLSLPSLSVLFCPLIPLTSIRPSPGRTAAHLLPSLPTDAP